MKLLLLAALALSTAAPSWAQVSQVQGVDCSAWRRERDGSWTATRPATVSGGGMSVGISPGMGIEKGAGFLGTDVVAYLERTCTRR